MSKTHNIETAENNLVEEALLEYALARNVLGGVRKDGSAHRYAATVLRGAVTRTFGLRARNRLDQLTDIINVVMDENEEMPPWIAVRETIDNPSTGRATDE